MNHVYARVWSHALGAWVVTSELASRRGKSAGGTTRKLVLSALATAMFPVLAHAVTSDSVQTQEDFADGIAVDGTENGGSIVVDSGSVTTTGRYADGIRITSGSADIGIDSEAVSISGAGANGVLALSHSGDIVIRSGEVDSRYVGPFPEDHGTHGDLTAGNGVSGTGVWGSTGYGSVHITSGSVTTKGDHAYGLGADTGFGLTGVTGSITLISASVSTSGQVAFGICAETTGTGLVSVDSDQVTTHGDRSHGIWAWSQGGAIRVDSDTLHTQGFRSFGIVAQGAGDVVVRSGEIVTGGELSRGIHASNQNGTIDIESGSVTTVGADAYGINASAGGDVRIHSGTVDTAGAAAFGIGAASSAGKVVVVSERLSTAGANAHGIWVDRADGVEVSSGTLATIGDFADGILVEGVADDGVIAIDSGSVTTKGRYADGIRVSGNGGADIRIDSDRVSVSGAGANGIVALSHRGDIAVDSDTVESGYDGLFPEDNGEHGDLSGVAGAGVWASTTYGTAEVRSGSVATWGEGAYGVGAETGWGATDAAGSVRLTSGTVSTAGNGAYGLYANTSGSGTVAVDSGQARTAGDYAIAVFARSTGSGDVQVRSGDARTEGYNSHGVYAVSAGGTARVDSATIATAGDFAYGILARGGQGAVVQSQSVTTTGGHGVSDATGEIFGAYGIRAEGGSGMVRVESGSVSTAGEYATGILVANGAEARVDSGTVTTTGEGADGIVAIGRDAVAINSGLVRTSGRDAVALTASAQGDVAIRSTTITTTGEASHGIHAYSASGGMDIRTGAVTVTGADAMGVWAEAAGGDIAIAVNGRVSAQQSAALVARAAAGAVTLDVEAGQVVSGGVQLHSANGTVVNIRGEIVEAGGGHALSITGGQATINNYSNTIVGSIRLTDEDDVFNNVGTWIATGSSDFGAGNDVLRNSGLVSATGSGMTSIANLTTFVNDGTLDLANGQSGDRFEVPGTTFVGGQGSAIVVDVDFANGSSDTLAVEGVQGTSMIQLNNVLTGPGFNLAGISIVESGQALSGSEFTMDVSSMGGLVDYDLVFDPASNRFVIKALPGAAAFELIKAGAAAQDFWNKSGEAWATRMVAARDAAAAGAAQAGDGVWVQAHGGGLDFQNSGRFDLGGGTVVQDMSTDSRWSGVQAGYDRVWEQGDGYALLGVTAGYTDYTLDFTSSAGRYELQGANVGVYGAVERGRFSVQGLVKVDRIGGEVRTGEASVAGDIDGTAWGARLEAGLRFGDRFWVEPLLGADWVKADLDDFESAVVDAGFEDADSLQGRAGVRFGGTLGGERTSWVPSLGLYAVDEYRGENGTVLRLGSEGHRAEDSPQGNYGRAEASLTMTTAGGIQFFARGGADFGSGTDGFNARAGLRWRW